MNKTNSTNSKSEPDQYFTLSEIKAYLKDLGLQQNDIIMLHASVRSINGTLIGGPDILLDAIMESIQPDGTLMMYVGWEDAPYHLSKLPVDEQKIYLEALPAFDPRYARAKRDHGILAEFLRTMPGALRSQNPGASCAALGKDAKAIIENHPLDYGYGLNSPFHKLCELNGKVLILGSSLAHITLYHYSECLCDISNKRIVKWKCPILIDNLKQWIEIEEYDTSNGIVDWQGDYFPLITQDYISKIHYSPKKIGKADSYLFDANDLNQFAVQWMNRNFKGK